VTRHDPHRTARVLEVIVEFALDYGHAPSLRQIGKLVGLNSPSSVSKHLETLRERGAIYVCRCGCGSVSLA
jgi:repressor LexA